MGPGRAWSLRRGRHPLSLYCKKGRHCRPQEQACGGSQEKSAALLSFHVMTKKVKQPRLGDSVRIKPTPGLQDRGRGEEVESAGLNHMDISSAEARDITASLVRSRASGKSSPLCPACPGKPPVLPPNCDLTTHLVLVQVLPLHLVPQTLLPHANPASSSPAVKLLPQGFSSWRSPLIQLPW